MKLIYSFLLLFTFFSCNSQIFPIKIEPPHWYSNIAQDTVQLMCQGENIGLYTIELEKSKNVTIKNLHRSDNSNYVWITLFIHSTEPQNINIIFKNENNIIHNVPYEIKKAPVFKNQNGFDQSDVIYLITPDRFADGDPTNNQLPGYEDIVDRKNPLARHGGDLKGILQQLDYIKDMGFTAVWLNPIIENNTSKYSYHGYAATDFYKIDARFGSNEEYKAFVQVCHKKGLKVIMDMIHNHSSIEHPWLKDLPSNDWINIWPSYTETNHRKSTLQDIHASEIDKKTYMDGWFVPSMPDLNQRNPFLSTYLIQNAIWWSLYLELDGIRMDTYSYPEKEYMKNWVDAMESVVPQVSIVGEEWTINPAHVAYWQKNKNNPDGFESNLQYLMDFPLNQLLAEALVEEENWNTGFIRMYESLANDFMYPNSDDLLVFLDNHDMTRGFTMLGENIDLLKLAMIFCTTTRGVPQIYYGTEILMTSPLQRDDGKIRADYPGGWENDVINAFTGEGLTEAQLEFRAFLTTLLNERKDEPVLHHGKLTHYLPKDGVYVYFRTLEDKKVMVILNKNKTPYTLELNRYNQFLMGGKIKGKELISAEQLMAEGTMTLDPLRGYVIRLN